MAETTKIEDLMENLTIEKNDEKKTGEKIDEKISNEKVTEEESESHDEDDSGSDGFNEEKEYPPILEKERLAEVLNDPTTRVVVVSGAGISTSAGIPDFRSSDGIYNMLSKYGIDTTQLADPSQIFWLNYFKQDPRVFYAVAKELFFMDLKPTICHYFLKLLQKKGILQRIYTQNIDSLEFEAGFTLEDYNNIILQCHGGMQAAHCIDCNDEFEMDLLEAIVANDKIPLCHKCDGYIKPDIVFFGESLPEAFHERLNEDVKKYSHTCTFVMGTSLQVAPVCQIPMMLAGPPRVLFNYERVGDFREGHDLCLLGNIDENIKEIIKLAGWEDDLATLKKSLKTDSTKKKIQLTKDELKKYPDIKESAAVVGGASAKKYSYYENLIGSILKKERKDTE